MEENKVLDTSIVIEAKEGLTTIFSIVEHPRALEKAFDIIWPENADYIKAVELMQKLYEIGKPVGGIDTLIAAMCINRNLILVTNDKHFSYIESVDTDFKVDII